MTKHIKGEGLARKATPIYIYIYNYTLDVTRKGFAIQLQVKLHLVKLQMKDMAWIGLVFLFLQLLLASRSEGENLLIVVE